METPKLYGKQTVVWVQRVIANKKQKRCFLRYKAQRTQFWCQLTKTYFRYYEAWGSVFSGEKLNRCFFWHKVRSFQFRCQQTKTCFPYDKGSKAKFNSEKKEKPALRNIMLKTAYHNKKQTKTLFWVKSSKIKVTRCKLEDNLFFGAITLETAQFYRTQTKTCFPAIKLHAAYLKHRKGETLFFMK